MVADTVIFRFSIRPFRRFPVCCPVTYQCGLSEGQGTVWTFSVNGWKLSGDVPLQVGQMCSLTVNLPSQPSLFVAAAIPWPECVALESEGKYLRETETKGSRALLSKIIWFSG